MLNFDDVTKEVQKQILKCIIQIGLKFQTSTREF